MQVFLIFLKQKKVMPNKDLDIGEPNDFENEVKDYWAGVIAGDTKLENGEKIFNDNNFYNSKHLKYEPGVIRGVLLALANYLEIMMIILNKYVR